MPRKKPDIEEVKAFAEKLYMTPGGNGKHAYSLQKVVDGIKQKFNVKKTRPTILNWSRVQDVSGLSWEQRYSNSIALGVKKSEITRAEKKGIDASEVYQDNLNKKVREQYEDLENMYGGVSGIVKMLIASVTGSMKTAAEDQAVIAGKPKDDWRKYIAFIPAKELQRILSPAIIKQIGQFEASWSQRLAFMRGEALRESGSGQKTIDELRELISG